MPNADTSGRIIKQMIEQFAQNHPSAQIVDNLGTQGYFSMMAMAAAMVGNSSSGLIEAPSFELPVVNIGNRQRGRVRGPNVIDVDYPRSDIIAGLKQALSLEFQATLKGSPNPYGSGQAAEKIVKVLKEVRGDERLIAKHFYDLDYDLETISLAGRP
jgi:UDP-N-acetylglucosamine 2-epimerase